MNHPIPVIAFSAYSGTGKTTLIEKLILYFKAQGLRLGVIKHDAHDFEIDKEGKDSWRFSKAGADITLISSAVKTAVIEQRPRSFQENLAAFHDVDLIIVEGYKQETIPRIGICRKSTGKGLPVSAQEYIALVTDDKALIAESTLPCFDLDDAAGLAEFIRASLHV